MTLKTDDSTENSFLPFFYHTTMTNPTDLTIKAQKLVNAYDDAVEMLEKWKDLTDEQIDAIIWTESDMWSMISALILMKKTHAERRKIAEKEEEKCMKFIARMMKRLKVEDRVCEDWKAVWKKTRRREYTDLEKIPAELLAPVWWKINSLIQQDEKVPWVEVVEWYLAVQVR